MLHVDLREPAVLTVYGLIRLRPPLRPEGNPGFPARRIPLPHRGVHFPTAVFEQVRMPNGA